MNKQASENFAIVVKNPPRYRAFRWTGANIDEAIEHLGKPVNLHQHSEGLYRLLIRAVVDGGDLIDAWVRPGDWIVSWWDEGGAHHEVLSDSRFRYLYSVVSE